MWRSGVCWRGTTRLRGAIAVGGMLLLLAFATAPSLSPVAAQPPRPTLTPTVGPPSPTPSASPQEGPTLPTALPCESICGRVINLETDGGEPGQEVRFAGAGWSVETTTDSGGNYAYGRLGTDVGFLNLVVPEGSDLHPITADIPIAPVPGWAIIINLGAYREVRTGPLLVPVVRAEPTWVRSGGRVTFTVQVENRLPTKISGVVVTDLLPEGLVLSGVAGERGDVDRMGNYGAAFIGDLGPGEGVIVRFIADVAPDTPSGTLRNAISLIYREHAAAQAVAAITVGRTAVATASPSGAAPTPRVTVTPAGTPQTLPSTGPALLPSTGYGLTVIGVGLALGGVALAARHARRRREKEQ